MTYLKPLIVIILVLLQYGCRTEGYFVKDKMSFHPVGDTLILRYGESVVAPTGKKGFAIYDDQYHGRIKGLSRTALFQSGIATMEILGINDSMCYVNHYDRRGRIRYSYCTNMITNRIDGIVTIYNKRGQVDICAQYENRLFKNVVYYRTTSILELFMRNNKDINHRFYSTSYR